MEITDYTRLTLGELLTHKLSAIRRAAMSILKTLQRAEHCPVCDEYNGKHSDDACEPYHE